MMKKKNLLLKKNIYEGKVGSYNIIIKNNLTENCKSDYCELCFKNDTNYCIVCTGNYSLETNENYSNFKKCEEKGCSTKMLMNNKCLNESISFEKYVEIYQRLKISLEYWKENKNNTIIRSKNVTYQMSSYNDQKYFENSFISNVDIGKCEDFFKKKYNINEDLIMIKTDIKNEDNTKTYVVYELYNPYNLMQLDLNECLDDLIIINTPVSLNNDVEIIYDDLNKSGYNLFDLNDSFYNDICSSYTTLNETDIIIEDRKELYSKFGNISLCQNDCILISYSSKSKKASCQCKAQDIMINMDKIDKMDISEIFTNKVFYNMFLITIKNSNFLVLKCFEFAFDIKNIVTNIGRIFMSLILIIFFIVMIMHFIKERNAINDMILEIVNNKSNRSKNKIKSKNQNINDIQINKISENKKNSDGIINKKKLKMIIN